MIATDSKIYFAKSTTFGIQWRSQWGTQAQAEGAAKSFVQDWKEIGLDVSARVFYRDGSAVSDFGLPARPPCECGNPNASWHGPRDGRRTYACDECAKGILEVTP